MNETTLADRLEHVCALIVEYDDRTEGMVLHRGAQDACREVAHQTPGVAVNGAAKGAYTQVMTAAEWSELQDV